MDIPVLLMGFNRPDLLTRALESLREKGVKNLYVSLDGPRFENEISSCEECFQCVQQYRESFDLKVLSRSSNLGCYLGVISNIDWFFSQVNFGIILEDDCIVDEEFFRRAQEYNDALELFLGYGVGMITAHNPFEATAGDLITEYSLIQGWAIAKETWGKVRSHILTISWPTIRLDSQRSLWENLYWWSNATRAKLGGIDTWDGAFSYAMFSEGYKCSVPSRNLISNFGFGLAATHTRDPDGSILIPQAKRESLTGSTDNILRELYFGVKPHHVFSALVHVLYDFVRFDKRIDFKIKLDKDYESRLIS